MLVAALLAEPPARLAAWRTAIGEALGPDAGLIVELIPELGVLLDAAPRAGDTGDAADRVPRLLVRLTATLAAPGRPLVLFLDDLQWADPASRGLVESLMKADEIAALYLIGSYRDNEIAASHPLLLLRDALVVDGLPVATIALGPLQLPSVVALLGEALGRSEAVAELAEVVVDKTGGNPFFVRAFVDALADADIVQLDAEARCWRWDIAAVRACVVTDNVVDLLVDKIARLAAAGPRAGDRRRLPRQRVRSRDAGAGHRAARRRARRRPRPRLRGRPGARRRGHRLPVRPRSDRSRRRTR